jgi:ATP-binding cassette, subfamily B, bacterial PglK
MEIFDIARRGAALWTRKERRAGLFIAAGTLVSAVIDIVPLVTAMPFIAMLIDPAPVIAHRYVSTIHGLLGHPAAERFVAIVGMSCIALLAVGSTLSIVVQRITMRWGANCQARLARDLLDGIIHAPFGWFLKINTGVVTHTVQRDVAIWAREFVVKIIAVLRDALAVLLAAALLALVTPGAGLLAIAGSTLLLAAVARFTRPRLATLSGIANECDSRATSYASQSLVGIKDIKISGREPFFIEQFAQAYRRFCWAWWDSIYQQALPTSAVVLVAQIALFGIAMTLWSVETDKALLAAQLGLLVLVTSRIVPAANRLAANYSKFVAVDGAIENIRRIIAETRAVDGLVPPAPSVGAKRWHCITFDHVSFAYQGSQEPALSGVSADIEFGRSYGIVGPSGAGKSTFADILMGFVSPARGQVLLDGIAMDEATWRALRSQIRYVPQAPFIVDDTIRANVAFGIAASRVDEDRVRRALEIANLLDLVDGTKEGLDLKLGDRGSRLSGGQRQRVAIARALYDDCRLLVLDEATSALDMESERAVHDAISRLAGMVTTVIIAHRMITVRDCHSILVFDRGRIVATGSWPELVATSPPFRRMVEALDRERAA